MIGEIDATLTELQQGRISRREAVSRVGALALGLAAGAATTGVQAKEGGSTFQARGLDHIALRVTDLNRSRDFYVKHLGARVTSQSGSNCFLDCGAGDFVALFKSGSAGMDHYCYRLDEYDPSDVVARLKNAGLVPTRRENRVYFPDPDGLTVQLSG
jgi:catechol 2,3-dioxygenase-like lactoylglutathione lyase family enzyme